MTQDHDSVSDPWAELNAKLDVDPATAGQWDPQPGDRLAGTLKEIAYRTTRNNTILPVLTIEQQDGEVTTVAAGRKVLVARLLDAKPQPGDLLGLQYDGLIEPGNGGRSYYAYRVAVVPVGDRDPEAAFKDPEKMTPDLGLTAEATADPDPWTSKDDSSTEVPF